MAPEDQSLARSDEVDFGNYDQYHDLVEKVTNRTKTTDKTRIPGKGKAIHHSEMCFDEDDICKYFKPNNHMCYNPWNVHHHLNRTCIKSCGFCHRYHVRGPACADERGSEEMCRAFKSHDMCERHYYFVEFIHSKCKKTCNFCKNSTGKNAYDWAEENSRIRPKGLVNEG